MKRIISIALCFLLAFLVTACGENNKSKKENGEYVINTKAEKDGIIYTGTDLSKYVKLGKYKGLEIDTASEYYKNYYDAVIDSDIENNDLYVKKTKGTVNMGASVNIAYEGKKDGVPFDGGTASGQDLVIGSGSFIDGFEEGLVGKEIGSTVDLNLTFPENYHEASLKGQAVVFTVKINYVGGNEKRTPDDYYKDLNYKSLAEYEAHVKETAIKNYLLDMVVDSSEIKSYPKKELKYLTAAYMNMLSIQISTNYQKTLAEYLKENNEDAKEYENSIIENDIKPTMQLQMIVFYILDKEGVTITKKDANDYLNGLLEENENLTAKDFIDFFGEYYFEFAVAQEKALDILYNNAVIS